MKPTRVRRSKKFKVLRTVEIIVVLIPIVLARMYLEFVETLIVIVATLAVYGFWQLFFTRHLSQEQLKNYHAVYEDWVENNNKVGHSYRRSAGLYFFSIFLALFILFVFSQI